MSDESLNRSDHVVAMVIHLQLDRIVKAEALANWFDMNLLTFYRNIVSLETTDVPVMGEAWIGKF